MIGDEFFVGVPEQSVVRLAWSSRELSAEAVFPGCDLDYLAGIPR